jgi:hypothetical protein
MIEPYLKIIFLKIFAGINYDGIVENSAKMFSENLVKALEFKKIF